MNKCTNKTSQWTSVQIKHLNEQVYKSNISMNKCTNKISQWTSVQIKHLGDQVYK